MTTAGEGLLMEALERFRGELAAAGETDLSEPTAMTLATADDGGRPQARTVLLKQVDERGFVFYTNRNSRKGRALAVNGRAALLFFWQPLMRQVEIEGTVEGVTDEEADAYWATRPRESQLGAWASRQSEILPSREEFEARLQALREEFVDREVPRPPYWSGFRVIPDRIEFWHGREFRQHERDCYWLTADGTWQWSMLNP